MDQFRAGDALRGSGVVAVMVTHTLAVVMITQGAETGRIIDPQALDYLGWPAIPLVTTGLVALFIFFGLSGYLIGRPFVRAYLDGRALPKVRPYLRNRALRIVPAFWVTATLMLILFGPPGTSVSDILTVYLFVYNYFPSDFGNSLGHTWSVDAEVLFYLLIPLVGFAMAWLTPSRTARAKRLVLLLGLLAFASAASALMLAFGGARPGEPGTLAPFFVTFASGLVLAALEPLLLPRMRGVGRTRAAAHALLGLGLLFLVLVYLRVGLHGYDALAKLGSVAAAAALLAAPMALQWSDGSSWRALDNRPLKWLGERSYSIYLVHMVPLQILGRHLTGFEDGSLWDMAAAMAVVECGVTIPVGALMYRFVERPFLERKILRRPGSLRPVPVRAQAG